MGWMDDAMVELRPWIGQVRVTEDDVGLMSVRRAAGTFDLDPDIIQARAASCRRTGSPFFGNETVRQSELRLDGHAKPGRRAAADPDAAPHGRRPAREDHGPTARGRAGDQEGGGGRHRSQERPLGRHLRADHAQHLSSRAARRSRSMRPTRSTARPCRQARRRPQRYRTRRAPTTRGARRPSSPTRSTSATAALTWNAHRIHYDGDYTRGEEGYPAIVSNGGLSMHLMVDAALKHGKGTFTAAPPASSIRCGSATCIEVRGEAQAGRQAEDLGRRQERRAVRRDGPGVRPMSGGPSTESASSTSRPSSSDRSAPARWPTTVPR